MREEERDGLARDVHNSRLSCLPIRGEQALNTAAKYLVTKRLNIAITMNKVCYNTKAW